MRRAIATIAVALLLAAGIVTGLRSRPSPGDEVSVRATPGKPGRYETALQVMGTDARLEVIAPDGAAARRMLAAAVPALRAVESLMSTYRPDSDVSRLNREGAHRPVELADDTRTVLREALRMSRLTGGAFDVTYAPLRTLWRRAQRTGSVPDEADLARALALVGWEKLLLEGRTARLAEAGMEVDLGGIAKGYAIDLAAGALQSAGARAGIVDVGGDLRLLGEPEPGGRWRVRVKTPPGVQERIVLALPPGAVTTSGDYARTFIVGDRAFSHIMDPRTGRPVADVPSVTVLAPEAIVADALATGLSVMGPAEGIALVESLPGVECMMMTRQADGSVGRRMSSGFARFVEEP